MMNKTDRIAKLKKMIAELPAGSISRKTINGKVYFYHQWQENGKTQGYSVSEEKAAEIKIQIESRRALQKELRALEKKYAGDVGIRLLNFNHKLQFATNPDYKVDTVLINAAECEPFITVDYRECMENSWDILSGVYLLKDLLGFKQVIIAVEDNKPDCIEICPLFLPWREVLSAREERGC